MVHGWCYSIIEFLTTLSHNDKTNNSFRMKNPLIRFDEKEANKTCSVFNSLRSENFFPLYSLIIAPKPNVRGASYAKVEH